MKKIRIKEEHDPLIGGKQLSQWDREWQTVPGGFAIPQPQLRRQAGLYRAVLHGESKVIGSATGKDPGKLAKRLADFRRPSNNGRRHHAANYIYENLDRLELQVLITGDGPKNCEIAAELRKAMIKLHEPTENVARKIVQAAIQSTYEKRSD